MVENEDLMYVARVKNGDSHSFRFLVEKYQNMAFTIAYKVTKDEEDAKDASQEGFVKAYQQIHRYEGKAKFSTWLYTIIYRAAIDKSKMRKFFYIDREREEIQYTEDTPVSLLLEGEQETFVAKAIDSLPPNESLMITLFYMNGSSIKEIADISGFSETNVKVKLFRAKKTLQGKLKFLL